MFACWSKNIFSLVHFPENGLDIFSVLSLKTLNFGEWMIHCMKKLKLHLPPWKEKFSPHFFSFFPKSFFNIHSNSVIKILNWFSFFWFSNSFLIRMHHIHTKSFYFFQVLVDFCIYLSANIVTVMKIKLCLMLWF